MTLIMMMIGRTIICRNAVLTCSSTGYCPAARADSSRRRITSRASLLVSVLLRTGKGGAYSYQNKSPRRHYSQSSSTSRSSSSSSTTATSLNRQEQQEKRVRLISFLTDVEGDRDYLNRFVNRSKVLQFCYQNTTACQNHRNDLPFDFPYDHWIDFQNDRDVLVFGGDVWDQGGSDLYCIRQLLYLQMRYPDRVHFIMGNRDINKMRILSELSLSSTDRTGVYWLQPDGGDTLPEHISALPPSNFPTERLPWMLQSTMGSPKAFNHRKWELEQENPGFIISDQDVVESYRKSCHPRTGEMGIYLSKASLALQLGKELLFVHGALPDAAACLEEQDTGIDGSVWGDLSFVMPWNKPEKVKNVTNIDEWVQELNLFGRTCVQNYQESHDNTVPREIWSEKGGYHDEPYYGSLIQYGMGWLPGKKRNPTVVYASWSNDGMPRRFFEANNFFALATREFFKLSGIALICSGHQPQGDMPNCIRVDLEDQKRSAWILSCDTSYSGDTVWYQSPTPTGSLRQNTGRGSAKSGRGEVCVSEVLIEQCVETLRVEKTWWHGVLSDGTEYCSQPLTFGLAEQKVGELAAREEGIGVDPPSETGHHWWKRAILDDGSVLLSAGKGFDFYNHLLSPPHS